MHPRSKVNAWWLHERPRVDMRRALGGLSRFIATMTVSKHRLFTWMEGPTLPDHQLISFARADDYFFGLLHSRPHEVWARSRGTQVRERESGFRYTPTTCFETFPFPDPFEGLKAEIEAAAIHLEFSRSRWLNPPEWTREEVLEFPGSIDGPWSRMIQSPDIDGIGTVRYVRKISRDRECLRNLASRTLTDLYNQRPTWLDLAHRRLDEAVLAAYGWPSSLSDADILVRLLKLNQERSIDSQGIERAKETIPRESRSRV